MAARTSAVVDRAFYALARWAIAAGGAGRALGEGALDVLARAGSSPAFGPGSAQRALWVEDAPALPPRPWRVGSDFTFRCVALRCEIRAVACARRIEASRQHVTTDKERGTAGDFPSCTANCPQGRGIREALDPSVVVTWRGAGPNHRFPRGRSDAQRQRAAFERLQSEGRLDRVVSMDEPPTDEDEG